MALDLGAFALVRAGTGIVQLLVGITFLLLARSVPGRLLGFSLVGYSAHYIVFDVTSVDPSTQIVAATVAPIGFALGTTATLALAWRIAPEARGA